MRWGAHDARVVIHSDQGVQHGSDDWTRFCKEHQLDVSINRRGNCFDNAVAESFFSGLKKERVRNRVFATREEARREHFDYIEAFYNRQRRRSHLGNISRSALEKTSKR